MLIRAAITDIVLLQLRVDAADGNGDTALSEAGASGCVEAITLLLRRYYRWLSATNLLTNL